MIKPIIPSKRCPFCGNPVKRQQMVGGITGLMCTNVDGAGLQDACGAVFSFRGRGSAAKAVEQFDKRVLDATSTDVADAMAQVARKVWATWETYCADPNMSTDMLFALLGVQRKGSASDEQDA